jgi:hypothetical protein
MRGFPKLPCLSHLCDELFSLRPQTVAILVAAELVVAGADNRVPRRDAQSA